MSDALHYLCAEVLSVCQTMDGDLDRLFHAEDGFAPRLRRICQEQIDELSDMQNATREELDVLRLERNTWHLIQTILPARNLDETPGPSARQLLEENPFIPPSSLAQAIIHASPFLNELLVVREWVQEIAPIPQYPGATTGYWPTTKHSVTAAKYTGVGSATKEGIVPVLDPDVVNRTEGRTHLSVDDTNYEKSVVQALYGYIRAGKLEDAVDLCRKAHQPWRAACINGSHLFKWRAIANEVNEEADMPIDDYCTGNKRRSLWKSTCIRAVLNQNLPTHERVFYAALAPSPQSFTVLKSACRTWEDHLWAQVNVVIEERESQERLKLGGSFWEGGMRAVEGGVKPVVEEQSEEEWEAEIRASFQTLLSVTVSDGPSGQNPFHFSQLYIILDATSRLVDTFAENLRNGSFNTATAEYATLCRFFAHLTLFLKMIDAEGINPDAVQIILEAYLGVLESAGQRDLIALYAAALGDNAVQRYATFLVSLGVSTSAEERRQALHQAAEHGLDVSEVKLTTAELSTDDALKRLPSPSGPLPSATARQEPMSEAEEHLIRSIEWTTFDREAEPEVSTLEQANIILRHLLASGRTNIAQAFYSSLPPGLTTLAVQKEEQERDAARAAADISQVSVTSHGDGQEFLQFGQFFRAWERLDRAVQTRAMDVPSMSRDTRQAWVREYSGVLTQAREQVVELLTTEWLGVDGNLALSDLDQSRRNLVRIRKIYIPELITRLHVSLVESRHHIPENLKHALRLANIVADSRHLLYNDFSDEDGKSLEEYLVLVRAAALAGLEFGGSDPFRVVMD